MTIKMKVYRSKISEDLHNIVRWNMINKCETEIGKLFPCVQVDTVVMPPAVESETLFTISMPSVYERNEMLQICEDVYAGNRGSWRLESYGSQN